MPALAMRMLMGPWWALAFWIQELKDSSEEIFPDTVKIFDVEGMFVIGRRSWAVTLQPWSGTN